MTNTRLLPRVVMAGLAALAVAASVSGADPRNVATGSLIYEHGYCDQPYVVVLDGGAWLCVFTTSGGKEGSQSQYIAATRSTDLGKTWSEPVPIEPPGGPEASWAMPLLTGFGRVYVFYSYNGDMVRALPDGKPARADMLGWYCAKYSDDGGATWSGRIRLPMRTTACDLTNDWAGQVQIFWGIGKPVVQGEAAIFAFTKVGKYMLDHGEGWFFRSDNVLRERDASKVVWELLPEGENGVRAPEFGSIQEEHNIAPMADGGLYCVYRTTLGHPAESYSRDGGRTWSTPECVRYTDGRPVKHPRACPRLWRTESGKYLLWHHNHGGTGFEDRNPAWVSGGTEKDGRVLWSQPEILLYGDDLSNTAGRFSYPDLIEQDGRCWVTTTQKTRASVHEVDPRLLEGLWGQDTRAEVAREGLALELVAPLPREAPRVVLPSLAEGGFAVEFSVAFEALDAGQVVLDTRNENGRGLVVSTDEFSAVQLLLSDANMTAAWTCDPGLMQAGKQHHVIVVVDGGPNIISFVVDGVLCDGGARRQFGWWRFPPDLRDANGGEMWRVAPRLRGRMGLLRVYTRHLRTSEAISNYRAWLSGHS